MGWDAHLLAGARAPLKLVMQRFISWRVLMYWPFSLLHSVIRCFPSMRHYAHTVSQ